MKSSEGNTYTGYKTIEELKSVTTLVDCADWDNFFSSDNKGQYSIYGFHQFLCERPEIFLLAKGLGDYKTAIQEILEEIGINEKDVNGPGANHIKLIIVDDSGFIVYETQIMNF